MSLSLWQEIYHCREPFDVGTSFDRLFAEGDTFTIGSLPARVYVFARPYYGIDNLSFGGRCRVRS